MSLLGVPTDLGDLSFASWWLFIL